jgi:hypothetical protein
MYISLSTATSAAVAYPSVAPGVHASPWSVVGLCLQAAMFSKVDGSAAQLLPEMHATSAGMKALCTYMTAEGLEGACCCTLTQQHMGVGGGG